jgi:hypothetical protein
LKVDYFCKREATLRDLRGLKLIEPSEGHRYGPASDVRISPEVIMRRAVFKTECIQIARAVMSVNPLAKEKDIADAVSLEPEKVWPSEATKKRNGNTIRRWMVWLEPHIEDPTRSSDVAARVIYAGAKRSQVGRPSLREAHNEQLDVMLAEYWNPTDMAAALNVTKQTIYMWLRSRGIIPREYQQKRMKVRRGLEQRSCCSHITVV